MLNDIIPALLTRYPGLQANQAGQGREETEDMASLGRMMAVAMLTIFVLLASQTRSYLQPFVVLAGVPFGAAGAVIGHFLLGYNISFISIFGIVALSGVVVNDALVLMDQYNRNPPDGHDDSGIRDGSLSTAFSRHIFDHGHHGSRFNTDVVRDQHAGAVSHSHGGEPCNRHRIRQCDHPVFDSRFDRHS